MTSSTPTRLVIPVPELQAAVPGAHIVLLTPFLSTDRVQAGVLAELDELFADVTPFPYVLGEPAQFPGGGRYLPPQPVGVFRRITHSLRHAFPELGVEETSISSALPHLTLPDDVEVPTPLEVHAREARLLTDDTVVATFSFGTSAA